MRAPKPIDYRRFVESTSPQLLVCKTREPDDLFVERLRGLFEARMPMKNAIHASIARELENNEGDFNYLVRVDIEARCFDI
jgi:hypothetical protein